MGLYSQHPGLGPWLAKPGQSQGKPAPGSLSPRAKCQDEMKQLKLVAISESGMWGSPGHSVRLSSRLWPAAPTLSFLTLVQGSLEKLSVSEISMSSPYRTPVRSFLTCYKEKAVGGCAGGHRKDGKCCSEGSAWGSSSTGLVFSTTNAKGVIFPLYYKLDDPGRPRRCAHPTGQTTHGWQGQRTGTMQGFPGRVKTGNRISGLSCWCFSALSRGFQVRLFTYTSIYILHYLFAIFHFQGDDRVRHSDRQCRIEEGARSLEPAQAVTRNFLSTDTQTANICVFRGQRSSNSGVHRVQPVCEAVCVEGCQGVVATVANG